MREQITEKELLGAVSLFHGDELYHTRPNIDIHHHLLQLLLGADVTGVATLPLPAVGGAGVQAGVTPGKDEKKI